MAEPRIVILGAGPAGGAAAGELVAAGLRPTVIDAAPASGGQIYRRQPEGFARGYPALYGTGAATAARLHAEFDALGARIDHRPATTAWGLEDRRLFLSSPAGHEVLEFDAAILATGATDRLAPVPGWTLPGVYTLGAAQIAMKAQAVSIGRRVAFAGTGPLLTLVAWQYARAGVEVAAVLDTASPADLAAALPRLALRPRLLAEGARMRAGLLRRGAGVRPGVTGIEILPGAAGGVGAIRWHDRGGTRETACDAVALGWHLRPETQLAELAGCRLAFDPAARLWLPDCDPLGRTSRADVYLAGDGARVAGAEAAETAGRLAALALAADLGLPVAEARVRALLARLRRFRRFADGLARAFPWPADAIARTADDTILCRCEAVTAGTFRAACREGAAELNRAKALCRVGMGRCQGRYCAPAAAEILAAERAVPLRDAGFLRSQNPIKPIPARP